MQTRSKSPFHDILTRGKIFAALKYLFLFRTLFLCYLHLMLFNAGSLFGTALFDVIIANLRRKQSLKTH